MCQPLKGVYNKVLKASKMLELGGEVLACLGIGEQDLPSQRHQADLRHHDAALPCCRPMVFVQSRSFATLQLWPSGSRCGPLAA